MSYIKLFENSQIRTVWNDIDQKWYFVISDVVQVLTDTPNPTDYIKKVRKRDEQLSQGWGQIVTPLAKKDTKYMTSFVVPVCFTGAGVAAEDRSHKKLTAFLYL